MVASKVDRASGVGEDDETVGNVPHQIYIKQPCPSSNVIWGAVSVPPQRIMGDASWTFESKYFDQRLTGLNLEDLNLASRAGSIASPKVRDKRLNGHIQSITS